MKTQITHSKELDECRSGPIPPDWGGSGDPSAAHWTRGMPVKPRGYTLVTEHVLTVQHYRLVQVLLADGALCVRQYGLVHQAPVVLIPEEETDHCP